MVQLISKKIIHMAPSQHQIQKILRNRMDFILINERFRISVESAETNLGTEINLDQSLLVAVIQTKSKSIQE